MATSTGRKMLFPMEQLERKFCKADSELPAEVSTISMTAMICSGTVPVCNPVVEQKTLCMTYRLRTN
ncbi:unnamed protein product [Caretta caretta]